MYCPPIVSCNGYNYRCIFIFMVGDSLEGVLEFSVSGGYKVDDLANRLPNNRLVDTNIYGRKILQLSTEVMLSIAIIVSTLLLTSYAHFYLYATYKTTETLIEKITLYSHHK